MLNVITTGENKMKATINKSTKMEFVNNGNVKRITKMQFGWIVEIVRAGEIVRRFECATMEQVKECE
tara:strand:- start:293 stop:493 length:201 start_codon:yes stop_codon:yes gene_type:complete